MCSWVLGGAFNVSVIIAAPQFNKHVHSNTRNWNYNLEIFFFIFFFFTFRPHFRKQFRVNILEMLLRIWILLSKLIYCYLLHWTVLFAANFVLFFYRFFKWIRVNFKMIKNKADLFFFFCEQEKLTVRPQILYYVVTFSAVVPQSLYKMWLSSF